MITAAKRGARAFGIEYNPDMVELSKKNAAAAGVKEDRATFMKADLFETDFSKATVITMFLLPDINLRLRPKILDMRPGTRIVSNTFTMGEWEADVTETVTEGCTTWCTALHWIVPAKVEGAWKLAQGGELALTQSFQNLVYGLVAFIPNLVAALIIFIIGWLIGAGLGKVVAQVVTAIRVDQALRAAGAGVEGA